MSFAGSSLPPSGQPHESSTGSLPPQSLQPQSLPPQSLPPMSLNTPATLATMSLAPPTLPTPTRRQPAWVVFAIVGLVALVLGIGTGLLLTRGSSGGGTSTSDTVLRFYTAVRDGNAQAALAELATKPADTSLMTDQVLRIAQQTAPITDLQVPATSSTVVQVSYRLGNEQLTDRVSVTAVGNGFKIITPPNSGAIQLAAIQRQGLDLLVADQRVTTGSIMLLPGAYPVRSSSKHLLYGQGTILVKRLDDGGNIAELAPRVTPEGLAAVKKAALASLTACTQVKSFAPPNCPFKYTGPSATTADPALSTWSLVGDPTMDLRLTLGTDPTKVELLTNVVARLVVQPGAPPLDIPTNGARGTVNLTQENLVVTWTA